MDALFGPNSFHKETQKKIQRNQKCKNVKMFVTVTLRCTRESTSPVYVEGFKTLYLRMRRFKSCFAHFFCPCSLMVKLSAVNRSSKVRFLPGTISYNIRILYEMAHSSRVSRNQKKRQSRDTRRRRSRSRVSNNTGAGLGLLGSLVGAAAVSQGSELEEQSGQGGEQSASPMMMSGGKYGRGKRRTGSPGNSAEYILRFMEMLNTIKIYHWSTLSYPTHKAIDELHEKLSELIDSFIEKYIGHLSRRSEGGSSTTGLPVFTKGAGAVPFCECKSLEIFCKKLDEYISYMEGLTERLDGYTDLVNIRDEMVGAMAQALYLLRLGSPSLHAAEPHSATRTSLLRRSSLTAE